MTYVKIIGIREQFTKQKIGVDELRRQNKWCNFISRRRLWKKKTVAIVTALACFASSISGINISGNIPVTACMVSASSTESSSDFVIEDGVLKEYTGLNVVVDIPEGVKEIEKKAFQNNKRIEKVIFPNTLCYIGQYAFDGCTNLMKVKMSYRLRSMAFGAFRNCQNLQSVDLSNTELEILDGSVFQACTSLTEAILPDGVKVIGREAFAKCTYLGTIYLPEGLTTIQLNAFQDCDSLSSVSLPDTLTFLGEGAFAGCDGLSSIRIPAGITTLQKKVFAGDYRLHEIYLPDTLRIIQSQALTTKNGAKEVKGVLTSLYLPESVEYIYCAGSSSNMGLNKASGIEEIQGKSGSYAASYAAIMFAADSGLGPGAGSYGDEDTVENFTPVEDNATVHFDACGGKLPDENSKSGIVGQMYGELPTPVLKGYTFLGWYQDKGLQKKIKTTTLITQKEISLYAKWEKEVAREEVYQGKTSDFTIENGVLKKYTGKESVVIVPDAVTEIGSRAFDDMSFITKIILPDGVTTIGTQAFRDCEHLLELNIPMGVTVIPDNMCQHCYSLQSIVIPEGVTVIGNNAFEGEAAYCSALSYVDLPDTLVRIGSRAFARCNSLVEVQLPEGLQEIGTNAFDSTALRAISIPAGVKTLSNGIFNGATGLEVLRLENGLEKIGAGFISGSECLEELYIPETVKSIEDCDYSDLSRLTIVGVKPGSAYSYYESLKNNSEYSDIAVSFKGLSQQAVIVFDTGVDDLVLDEKQTYIGLPFGILPRLSREGKVFEGWSMTEDITGLVTDKSIIDQEEIRLTAIWRDVSVENPQATPLVPEPDENKVDKTVTEIRTPQDLSKIRENLHGCYKLMEDIDLSEVTSGGALDVDGYGFCPIGAVKGAGSVSDKYTEKSFDGVLDGNGHTISGLTIRGDTPYVGVGLFARVEGGMIKNLNLKNVHIEAGTSTRRVGAIAGLVDEDENTAVQGSIENVTVSGEVKMTTGKVIKSQMAILGGAVGYVGHAEVSNVKNTATVSYWSREEEQPESACSRYIGGVAGYMSGGTIYQCSNIGGVSVYRDYYGAFSKTTSESHSDISGIVGMALSGVNVNLNVGGILGYAASAEDRGIIEQCYNTSDVLAVMNNRKALSVNVSSHSDVWTGGIVGYLYGNTGVINCYNKGDVIGKSLSNTSLLGKDAEDADALRQYLNSHTVGAFTNADAYAAGIVGSSSNSASGPIKCCYNTGKIGGSEGKVYAITNGDIPVAYSRYAAMNIMEGDTEVAITGTSRTETLSTCQAVEEDQLARMDSYRGFEFGNEWILIEDSGMESPILLGNMEEKIHPVRFLVKSDSVVQMTYAYGEELNLSGLQLELKIGDLDQTWIMDIVGGVDTGYDPYQVGDQTLTISCAGMYYGLTVHVEEPTYELIVLNGSGSGYYKAGTKVVIQAEDIAQDKRFLRWVSDGGTAEIQNSDSVGTTVTLGTADSAIAAEYEQLYEVKVTNGSGSGFYGVGDKVTVTAEEPQEGYVFSKWVGTLCNNSSVSLEHPEDSTMTFEIPSNPRLYPLKLTAKYVKESSSKGSASPTPESSEASPTSTPGTEDVPATNVPGTSEAPSTMEPQSSQSPDTTIPETSKEPSFPATEAPKKTEAPQRTQTPNANKEQTIHTTSQPEPSSGAGPVTQKDNSQGKVKQGDTIVSKGLYYRVCKERQLVCTGAVSKKKKTVTIPKTVQYQGIRYRVTAISAKAFYKMSKLEKVTIGNDVETIGKSAFEQCRALQKISFGKSVAVIQQRAFYLDTKIQTLDFCGKNLKKVGKMAFSKGKSKKNVLVPRGVDKKKYYRLLQNAIV